MSKILLLDGEGVQVVCMGRELNKLGHELTALCTQKVSSGYATKYITSTSRPTCIESLRLSERISISI